MKDPRLSSTLPLITPTPAPVQPPALSTTLSAFGSPVAPGVTDQKRASVQETTTAKQLALADEDTLRTLAAARVGENDLAENPIYQDLRTLSYGELVQKYGSEVARNSSRILRAEVDFDRARNDPRTDAEITGDTAKAVGQGIWNMAGSLSALGAGMINDDFGAFTAGLVQDGSEWIEGTKSTRYQEYMKTQRLLGALDDMDNEAQYAREQADPEQAGWMSTARYWGRSARDEIGRVINDPVELGNFAAENIGTLLPSAGLARGAQALTKGTKLAPAAVPTAVALGESGAAYVGGVNRVMEMTEAELMESSPDYVKMRAGGATHEQALTEIATDAGMLAAALQFPIAAAAGKMVERFEANPLGGAGSITNNLKELGTQTLEEAIQEGTGQFNQNVGIQTFADENQALDEGVAEGAALGALGGTAMAGILKTPGIVGGVAAAGAKAAGRGLLQAVDGRRSSLEAEQDSQNPVGTANTQSNLQNVDAGLSKALTTIQQPVQGAATSADPIDPEIETVATRIRGVAELNKAEISQMPASVKAMFLPADTLENALADDQILPRGEVMFEVLKEMRNADPEVRKEAVLWLNDQVNRLGSLQGIDLSKLNEEARNEIVRVAEAANQVMSNATVSKAVEEAQTLTQADLGALPEVTPETINTPEVQSAIAKTSALAQANPAGVDPRFIDTVLDQSTRAGVPLDAVVESRLRVAAHIARTMQGAEAKKKTLIQGAKDEKGKTVAQVREEILRTGKNSDVGQYGLDRHMAEITTAMAQNDMTKVQVLMRNLRNFAESMQNKVEAANRSIQINDSSRNKVPYRAWTGSAWKETTAQKPATFYVLPSSQNTVLTGRAVVEDATMVADLYDGLLERLGGAVQGEKISRVQADPLIAQATAQPAPEVVSGTASVGRASDLPPESPEPEAQAPAKERRIRKDAVLRSEESLIDESESDPVRPLGADETGSKVAKPAKEKRDVGNSEPSQGNGGDDAAEHPESPKPIAPRILKRKRKKEREAKRKQREKLAAEMKELTRRINRRIKKKQARAENKKAAKEEVRMM